MNELKQPLRMISLWLLHRPVILRPVILRPVILRLAILSLAILLFADVNTKNALAGSAIDLVAGFDTERIEGVFPIDKQSIGEAAKLLYRARKVNPESFANRSQAGDAGGNVGDAVQFDGLFESAKAYAIPDSLIDLLGFDSFSVITMDVDQDQSIRVIASSVPVGIKPDDRLNVIGMVVESGQPESGKPEPSDGAEAKVTAEAVVAAKMTWHPRVAASPSWQWLADRGVDIANLPGLKTRNRKPLTAADSDVFYSIMSAASQPPPLPEPANVQAIDLLSDPNSLVADFLTLPVEIIQVTRVAVTDAGRQRQLGRDHYFQVDTIGDLGNVVVKIEPIEKNSEDKPAIFENRYPVSIVMLELPEFLKTAIQIHEGGDAVVSDIRAQVQVDGFFFRLWSYETDYMKQFGDEKQFGPLLIAARLQNLESNSPDPLGVNVIGWIAAGLIGISMIGIFVWHRLTSAGDAKVRRGRRDKSVTEIDLSS